MARNAAILEDVDYSDVTPGAESDGASSSDETDRRAQIPLSKKTPQQQWRILKGNIQSDLEYSLKWRKQATDDLGFVSGDQWSDEDKQILDEQGRPHNVFNRIETILRAIAGMEINGRHEINFLPRNNDDTAKNELLTAVSKWMGDGCDAEDEQSEAFQQALGTGLGVSEARYSYENEAEGSYIEEQIDSREFVWDRTARKKNLRDARRMGRLRRMPLIDALQMFPGKTRRDIDAQWANQNYLDEATLKSIEEKRIRDENTALWEDYDDRNEVTVVVIQWREKESYWRVADIATNTVKEYDNDQYKMISARMNQIGSKVGAMASLHARQAYRWRYYQAFLGANALLDKVQPAPCGNQFSWGVITGAFDAKKRQWYGLVRVMRDPQQWANKFLSQIMQIMNSTAKGGILAEADAFDDQRQAEETYAMPEAITWMTPGSLSGQKPKVIPKPGQGDASAYVNLLTYAVQSITAVTGINLELLGQQDKDQPGIVEHMRKQAGMTVLATMFDSLRGFLKMIGRKRLYFIQTRIPDGTMVRVAGGEYAQVVQVTKDKTTGNYDVVVDDAPTSPNMKEANWAVMQPMLTAFKDQFLQDPQLMILALEYSPLPSAFVDAMKKAMVKSQMGDPGQQQWQETMKQLAISKLTAEINKDQSIAEMNNAKAGATNSTATYDLAMAQNLLAKNDIEGFQHHIQAMSEAAKAELNKAKAAQTIVSTHKDMQQTNIDHQQHVSDMLTDATDRAATRHQAAVDTHGVMIDHHKALTDRIQAHLTARQQQLDMMNMQADRDHEAQQGQADREHEAQQGQADRDQQNNEMVGDQALQAIKMGGDQGLQAQAQVGDQRLRSQELNQNREAGAADRELKAGDQRLKAQQLRQTDEHNRRQSEIARYTAVTGAQQAAARDSEKKK
jgi:hypothetical protein